MYNHYIIINHHLSWNSHINHITFKAQRVLNLLNRTCRDLTDIKIEKLLYNLG